VGDYLNDLNHHLEGEVSTDGALVAVWQNARLVITRFKSHIWLLCTNANSACHPTMVD